MPDENGSDFAGSDLEGLASQRAQSSDQLAGFARAVEHQRRWGMPPAGTQLADMASRVGGAAVQQVKGFNDLIGTAMTADLPEDRARAAAELGYNVVTGGMGRAEKGALGMAGGALKTRSSPSIMVHPEARDFYNQTFGKIVPLSEFSENYFGGMHNPFIRMRHFGPDEYNKTHRLHISGDLMDQGEKIGSIMRELTPETRSTYHTSLHINEDYRKGGYSKKILGDQFQFYEDVGMRQVGILAADDGASVWGKYGFVPWLGEWETKIKPWVNARYKALPINQDDAYIIAKALNSPNPKDMWLINDIKTPYVTKKGEKSTIGFQLLKGTFWHGGFDFKDMDQLERNRAYLKR